MCVCVCVNQLVCVDAYIHTYAKACVLVETCAHHHLLVLYKDMFWSKIDILHLYARTAWVDDYSTLNSIQGNAIPSPHFLSMKTQKTDKTSDGQYGPLGGQHRHPGVRPGVCGRKGCLTARGWWGGCPCGWGQRAASRARRLFVFLPLPPPPPDSGRGVCGVRVYVCVCESVSECD